jgi:hypothetical protein
MMAVTVRNIEDDIAERLPRALMIQAGCAWGQVVEVKKKKRYNDGLIVAAARPSTDNSKTDSKEGSQQH